MNAMMYQIDIFTCQGCFTDFESKESVDGHYHLCPGAVKDSKVSSMPLTYDLDLDIPALGVLQSFRPGYTTALSCEFKSIKM